jgi:hypothetical protein
LEKRRSDRLATLAAMTHTLQHLTRQSHRWLSIVFTVAVAANFVARALQPAEPPAWITYAPLPPLFLQLVSGLYLFALPYFRKRPAAGR